MLLAVCLDVFSNTTVKFDVIILNWHLIVDSIDLWAINGYLNSTLEGWVSFFGYHCLNILLDS